MSRATHGVRWALGLVSIVASTAGAQLPAARIAPSTVVSGANASLQLTLPSPAPAAGVPVRLSSSAPEAVVFAASGTGSLTTTFPGGQTTFAVSLRTLGVATSTPVMITVSTSVGSLRTTVTVSPATVASVSVQPSTGPGGAARTGTLTLTGLAAPTSGTSATLVLSNPQLGAVPATVTVPAGSRSVTFPVLTQAVATTAAISVTATGSAGEVVKTGYTLAAPVLRALTLGSSRIVGGTSVAGTVQLDAPAATGGVAVHLSTTPASDAIVLRDLVVPAGASQAAFSITTVSVAAPLDVVLTATAMAPASPVIVSTPLSVLPLTVTGVSASALHMYGGDATDITVQLSGLTGRDLPVPLHALQTSGTAQPLPFVLPPSITVPAGGDRATVRSATQPVTAPAEFRIVAAPAGTAPTATNSVRVGVHARPVVQSLTVSPSPIVGSQPLELTVLLAWPPAPAFATTPVLPNTPISFTSSSPLVPPGPSLPVSYLQPQLRAPLAAGPASVTGTVTLGARSGTSERTVTVGIEPAPAFVSALQLAATSVVGGSGTTGAVVLNRAADPAGLTVALNVTAGGARIPSSVQVPGGARQATFPITTVPVSTEQSVSITATAPNTAPVSAALRITRVRVTSVSPQAVAAYGGGDALPVVITLDAAAPAGGVPVLLTSALAGVTTAAGAVLPAIITVPAGASRSTVALQVPPVSSGADAQLRADVVASATLTPSATLLTSNAVSSGALPIVPLPTEPQFFGGNEILDFDRPTGLMRVEFTVRAGTELSSAVASTLPPVWMVVDTDHPETVRPDSVRFVPGTRNYTVQLRTVAPLADVTFRPAVRLPNEARRLFATSLTVRAPRLYAVSGPGSVIGGNSVELLARLTREAGPGGVEGTFGIQGNVVRANWAAGRNEIRVTLPTKPVSGTSDNFVNVQASTGPTGGVSSSKVHSLDVLGTDVIDLLNNGASTLLAGESSTIVAVLQNPAPESGHPGVVFVSSTPSLLVNDAASALIVPTPGRSGVTTRVQVPPLPSLPAVTRTGRITVRSLLEPANGSRHLSFVMVPPPNLLELRGPSASVSAGSAHTLTVRVTPYDLQFQPRLLQVPIRIESSHPALIPPSTVTLRIDNTTASTSVVVGQAAEPTRVTLRATIAGNTVTTTVLVIP